MCITIKITTIEIKLKCETHAEYKSFTASEYIQRYTV